MVLLSKITEDAIVDNLKKRYMDDYIFVSYKLPAVFDVVIYTCSLTGTKGLYLNCPHNLLYLHIESR